MTGIAKEPISNQSISQDIGKRKNDVVSWNLAKELERREIGATLTAEENMCDTLALQVLNSDECKGGKNTTNGRCEEQLNEWRCKEQHKEWKVRRRAA